MNRPQAGFTLLEVVVAVAVVGAGFAVGLGAMSGSLRLMRSATEYEQATLLARAVMTEALSYPDYDVVADRDREIYQGIEYAYRIEFRPVRMTNSGEAQGATMPVALQQISVDVFWGSDRSRNYRLVTYRRTAATTGSQTRVRTSEPPTPTQRDGASKDGTVGSGGPSRMDGRPGS
jgi:prepilin-type N-terminal cleavage/methylation domain-containing protein